MKKIISLTLCCMLLVGALLSLVSCGEKTLSGKYESAALIGNSVMYEFDRDKTVTVTGKSMIGLDISLEGTYSIEERENGLMIITFSFPTGLEGADDFKGEHIFLEGTESGVDYIKIDGIQYKKVK